MNIPIDWVQLSNGSTWRVATSITGLTGSARHNMLCIASDGLLDGGENDLAAEERSYSDGSVLPPAPRFAGLDFTLDFALFSQNKVVDLKPLFENFKAFLKSGTLTFTSSYGHSLTVQVQRIQVVKQDWTAGLGGRLLLSVFFKAAEAA